MRQYERDILALTVRSICSELEDFRGRVRILLERLEALSGDTGPIKRGKEEDGNTPKIHP